MSFLVDLIHAEPPQKPFVDVETNLIILFFLRSLKYTFSR